jgi:phage terminase small subunit
MTKPKLTPKQKVFVDEYVKNKGNATQAALKAYDTDDYQTAASIGEENLKKPEIRTITEQLFPIEKTQKTVDNLYYLSTSADDQKNQIEAAKTILAQAIPKTDTGGNNFIQINNNLKSKYE